MTDDVSRRSMLGLGVAGAATLMAGQSLAADPDRGARKAGPDAERIGFAIVGLGKLSQGELLPAFRNTSRAKLVALVSGDPAKARRIGTAHGLPADALYSYDDYDRIAHDPRIDVVYIVLPNSMHAEYTIRALKAGKHVLCEKPMATSIAECEAMIAAAKSANRKLMIAYRCHYEPLNLAAMRMVRSGRIGRPKLVITEMGKPTTLSDPSDAWRLDMKMSGGGALADMGIYGINASRYLLNEEPEEVRAWAMTDRSDPRFRTVEDMISWQFRFPSGAIASGTSSFSQPGTMAYQVVGDRARLIADPGCFYGGNQLRILTDGSPAQLQPITEIDQFAREMDWMADVVRGKAPLVSTGEEGLQDMRLMHAILRSVAEGGATIDTRFGYRRALDPAAVVDVRT